TLDPRQIWRRTARSGKSDACKTMHLLHAWLKNGEIAGKWHKKPAFRVPVWVWFCRDYWPRNAPITLLRHMLATISRKIVVQGFS
ncbi:TPA: hypothetical protein ACJH2U_003117, partial [Salmonella enterica subsp. enterica serovar Saintpaul]